MDNKKRNILLGVLIVGVISMTVAFAALSTTLNISGTASLPTTKWDIHFDNGVDNTPKPTHANGKVNKGTITGLQFAATSISNFTATLYQPNDEVVYNFDIVNAGTIDGQLDNFSKTLTCNSSDCSMITYTIDCEDASHNDANQSDYILAHGQSVSCVMKIKYNEQTNSGNGIYEQGAVNATATASWLYKQVEGSNNSSGNNAPTPQPTGNWDNYITPTQASGSTLPQGAIIWIQQNTNSGENEVCKIFSGGTVCLTNSQERYEDNFGHALLLDVISTRTPTSEENEYEYCNNGYSYVYSPVQQCVLCPEDSDYFDNNKCASNTEATVTGYAAIKKAEFESKGATCSIEFDSMYCFDGSEDKYCYIDRDGGVDCYEEESTCDLSNVTGAFCQN